MNREDIRGAWECMKTLYRILPPNVEMEVQPAYDKVNAQLEAIRKRFFLSIVLVEPYYMNYLYGSNRWLLGIFKNSLHKHGYLEEFPITGLNPRPKHIGSEE
jgi:hypothetical protein